ncbi:BZ3500_MvSof-1268-A1-R1_Chr3-1g05460 [Microbotryum saponariae]|uniref:LSM2-LSM8 complex subunit LSM8 n=1 Tax=Microbotryum saponariae TaxID=289078 RepID=A0A2X0LQR0_9BASI|nr:BZ3500_MvSof-1268-A1-R1_Chr3-1g05460 [Microbotryum saponariae]
MRLRGREAASHRAERTNAPSHALNPQSSIPHPRPIPVTPSPRHPVTPSPRHPVTPSLGTPGSPQPATSLGHLATVSQLRKRSRRSNAGRVSELRARERLCVFVRGHEGVLITNALTAYVDKRVLVITQDGRTIVGTFAGFDQTTNIILSSSTERIYSLEEGVDEQALGLFVVRGDNITLIGELDEVADKAVDLSTVRAEPIQEIVH